MPVHSALRLLPFFLASPALFGACAEPSQPVAPPRPDAVADTVATVKHSPPQQPHRLLSDRGWDPPRAHFQLRGPAAFKSGTAVLEAENAEVL
ncbi:MAG: hypothetical protein ABI134_18645, partial [Byssovorax sp.]